MEIAPYTLLNYLLETSICLAVFYLFYVLALRRQPTFIYNRMYLLVSSLLALILPLLEVPFFGSASEGFARMSPGLSILILPEVLIGEEDKTVQMITWQQMVILTYATGALLMLIRFLWQIMRIRRIIRQGHLRMSQNGYWVVHTDGHLPISSYFNYLLWDNHAKLEEGDKQRIIEHEEVHMAQGHSYDVFYMSLIKILLWFHPFAYLYFKELTDVHEYAADAKVVEATDAKSYARILVNQLFHSVEEFSLLNHFYKSKTLKRLKMMELTKSKINRFRILWALPVFALMFFVFSCQDEEDELSKLNAKSQEYANATEEEWDSLSDADEVFTVVENPPTPEGGMEKFYDYVKDNLKYPAQARYMGIEGRVFIQFVVDKDGTITEVEAIKGIGAGCDEAAEEIMKNAPAWNPGLQRDRAVKVRMVLPITFSLGNGEVDAEGVSAAPDKMNVQSTLTSDRIVGKVTSPENKPLSGVNIIVKGTTFGTVTDINGNYQLPVQNNASLIFSHIGYASEEITIKGQSVINVSLSK